MTLDENIILNDTQETNPKTEEELKRDRRNAMRRATYRMKKDRQLQDENAQTLNLSGKL